MASATRVLGWSLLIALLVGVLWPERPEIAEFAGVPDLPLEAATYEAPPQPDPPPGGGCPTATCLRLTPLPSLRR